MAVQKIEVSDDSDTDDYDSSDNESSDCCNNDDIKPTIQTGNIENLNYLYPNVHVLLIK